MSLRALARPLASGPSRRAAVAAVARPLSTSGPRRAAAGGHHDDHSHGHGHEDASDAYTTESFLSPTTRNTLILLTAAVLIYPYLPSPSKGSASPSTSPSAFSKAAEDSSAPWVTRWLAKNTPKAEVWTERNDKHLELTKEAAEERLLFQEAERPRVWRMRYPSAFEQASPHGIAVGSQVDLSDLKVKPE